MISIFIDYTKSLIWDSYRVDKGNVAKERIILALCGTFHKDSKLAWVTTEVIYIDDLCPKTTVN